MPGAESANRTLTSAEPLFASRPRRIPALTIAYHPDVRRAGAVAILDGLARGAEVMLSRLEPDFVPAGGGQGRPLADPFLSRTPIVLKNADGGVGISVPPGVQLEVDALPVSGGRYVDPEELERGTVLTVAERMVLFLHLVSWPRPEAAPKLGLV
ncbi:MAG: sigma-54-dependent Fis family transcriptional regulator, partial [Myxococcales bacterium]